MPIIFLLFLTENTTLFPESEQEKHFSRTIAWYFVDIKNEIDEEVKTKLSADKKIAETSVKDIVARTIKKHFDIWDKTSRLNHIDAD